MESYLEDDVSGVRNGCLLFQGGSHVLLTRTIRKYNHVRE